MLITPTQRCCNKPVIRLFNFYLLQLLQNNSMNIKERLQEVNATQSHWFKGDGIRNK